MAHCEIKGTFKEDSQQALEIAKEMGAWGACSYSVDFLETFSYLPANEGTIHFELFGRSPFEELRNIADVVCKPGYIVSIMEWDN